MRRPPPSEVGPWSSAVARARALTRSRSSPRAAPPPRSVICPWRPPTSPRAAPAAPYTDSAASTVNGRGGLAGGTSLGGGRRGGGAGCPVPRLAPPRPGGPPRGRPPAPLVGGAFGTRSGRGFLAGRHGRRGTSVDSVVKLSENP